MTPTQFAWNAVQARNSLPHGQRPTDLHIRIAWLRARWQSPDPPHAKLARAAHCHRNSVANALHRFRALGLLTWQLQAVRLRGGWVARVANRYLFKAPSLPAAPSPESPSRRKVDSIFPCPQSLCIRCLRPMRSRQPSGRWLSRFPDRETAKRPESKRKASPGS